MIEKIKFFLRLYNSVEKLSVSNIWNRYSLRHKVNSFDRIKFYESTENESEFFKIRNSEFMYAMYDSLEIYPTLKY